MRKTAGPLAASGRTAPRRLGERAVRAWQLGRSVTTSHVPPRRP